jgi:uncharacterized protein
MSQPFKLLRLQQIDSQLDSAHARLNEIDRIMSEDRRLKSAQEEEAQKNSRLKDIRTILNQAEAEVKAQQIKIEQTESSLYGGKVSNPKELQDLQKELAALKRYLSVLEDRQLEQMLLAEDADSEYRLAVEELEVVRSEVASQHGSLVKEQEILQKDIQRMEGERQAAASTIEADHVALYEQLRKQRKGIAVSKVSDRACSACGSTLTPSMVQSAQSPNIITRCTFCGRILYAG